MSQRFWKVSLSYLHPPTTTGIHGYRDNALVGVVAETIEEAIIEAKRVGTPPGGLEPTVWSVSHHGEVHSVAKGGG